MTNDEQISALIKAVKRVANQLEFSSMSRSGDPSQQDDMKMEAVWCGELRQHLPALEALHDEMDMLREALEDVKKHCETTAPNEYKWLTAWNITDKALKQEEMK